MAKGLLLYIKWSLFLQLVLHEIFVLSTNIRNVMILRNMEIDMNIAKILWVLCQSMVESHGFVISVRIFYIVGIRDAS